MKATNWPMIVALALLSAPSLAAQGTHISSSSIRIEFDNSLHSRVVAFLGGKERVIGEFTPSEFIRVSGRDITDFTRQKQLQQGVRDRFGLGVRDIVTGTAPAVKKTVTVTRYDAFPRVAFVDVEYTNTGSTDLAVSGWTNQHYSISAAASAAQPAFWSYQSGSYESRPDWVLPLKPGFKQENFLGMNAPDYGGGTPVVDVWCRDVGIAVGHVEMAPKLVSLPVATQGPERATVAVEFKQDRVLKPGATLKTFSTFAAVHPVSYTHLTLPTNREV